MYPWVKAKYEGIPCMECNGVFPWCVMDFDHRPEEDKSFGIATFSGQALSATNIAKIEKEIAKCDIVCSNCHRIRTRDRYKH